MKQSHTTNDLLIIRGLMISKFAASGDLLPGEYETDFNKKIDKPTRQEVSQSNAPSKVESGNPHEKMGPPVSNKLYSRPIGPSAPSPTANEPGLNSGESYALRSAMNRPNDAVKPSGAVVAGRKVVDASNAIDSAGKDALWSGYNSIVKGLQYAGDKYTQADNYLVPREKALWQGTKDVASTTYGVGKQYVNDIKGGTPPV